MLIRAFRIRGHLIANLDPLSIQKKEEHPELKPETYGFTKKDYNRKIFLVLIVIGFAAWGVGDLTGNKIPPVFKSNDFEISYEQIIRARVKRFTYCIFFSSIHVDNRYTP